MRRQRQRKFNFNPFCLALVGGGLIFGLSGCGSKGKVLSETPLTTNLGAVKNVRLEVSSSAEKGTALIPDLRSYVHKRFTKAKLFEKIQDGEAVGASKNFDMLIKADIFDAMVPDKGFKISLDLGAAKAAVKVRYTLYAKDGKTKIGQFVAESDSKNKPSYGVGGFDVSNSDASYAVGRNVDAVVKYLKEHL